MSTKVTTLAVLTTAATLLLCSESARADAVLSTGSYQLLNHPDGNAQPPLYGLRLDGLSQMQAGDEGVYTFDFNHASSFMQMDLTLDGDGVSTNKIRIHGQVYGGLNSGSGYSASHGVGLWDVDFTYGLTDGSDIQIANDGTSSGDVDRIFVKPENNTENNGSITPLFDDPGWFNEDEAITLWDYVEPDSNAVFLLDYGHRTAGHAGFANAISGWGWVTHGSDPNAHLYDSDWLFIVDPTPIPAPGAALLAMAGFGMVGWLKRRLS